MSLEPWPELFIYFIFHNQIPSFIIWLETAYFQPIFFRCLTLYFSIIVMSECEYELSHSGLKKVGRLTFFKSLKAWKIDRRIDSWFTGNPLFMTKTFIILWISSRSAASSIFRMTALRFLSVTPIRILGKIKVEKLSQRHRTHKLEIILWFVSRGHDAISVWVFLVSNVPALISLLKSF